MAEWGYRKGKNGEVEARLFDEKREKGWHDSPAKVKTNDQNK